jgi:NADPH2:quinone reductase
LRAWVCHELTADRGGLRFHPDWRDPPEPGPNQLRVRLAAAAINYPDLLMLSGGYQFRPELPFIPGVEACGIIDEVGEGLLGDLIGERVIVGTRSGCLAELITVDAAQVRPVPAGLHDDEAAAHSVGTLTAYVSLAVRGRVQAGERVLVLGAGGGVGLAAVGTAKALGATVIAATGDAGKAEVIRAAGADEVLTLDRAVPDLSAFKGAIDVVYDPVGGAAFAPALATLAWNGRYLLVGFVAGQPAPPATNRLLLKGIEIIGVRAGEHGRRDPAAGAAAQRAIDALAEGGLRPHVGMKLPLERADELFAAMAEGAVVGKAVATMG